MGDEEAQPEFRQWYDRALDVGPAGNLAFFGRDVLAGMVQGIRDFRERRQQRWDQYHGPGATLLGCAMWMDDPELLDELARLQAACVVVSKQARDKKVQPPDLPYKLRRLADLNARTPGLPVCYFPPLVGVRLRVHR
ncbi:hypothetical protein FHU28_000288 [Micromonospora echinospora]|uniref:Uncharacterized protein n=1 Tax=Micromonospora echinospora TaxID=1877 RepID=A0ABR6M5T7_MICEC|nr:hypothetical protein [Micromonospora echinospora]MBB5110449.1 hypothetical protein [Micromonospora echinospora]